MFQNIGRKIRILAMVLCWIGIIAFIIIAISMLSNASNLEKELQEIERSSRRSSYYSTYTTSSISSASVASIRTTGWVLLIVGPLASWISSFVLYGFGELIEWTANIDSKIDSISYRSPAPTDRSASPDDTLEALNRAFTSGVITAAEYERKKSEMGL